MIVEGFQQTSVLSLCKDFNNPVMWSMYGNRGNGICIGFENLPTLVNVGSQELWSVVPHQVSYAKERPVYNYYGAVATFLLMTPDAARCMPKRFHSCLLSGLEQGIVLWTKNDRWSYEEEYRMICSLGSHMGQLNKANTEKSVG